MKKYFAIYPRVFYPSFIFILLFVLLSVFGGEPVKLFFERVAHEVTATTGWIFILGVNFFVLFCLWAAFGKFGNKRLGGAQAKPEFSVFSWFSMLFSAGMGIGLLYFSVSEPITHFMKPPMEQLSVTKRAIQALDFTFLHYGLHAWAIYCIVGLALAYYTFNKNLPFSLRSIFFPFLGRKINTIYGDIIDIIAVVATLFGLATSLGFGARQIASGINFLFGIDAGVFTQIAIIIFITLIATLSVITGLKKGVLFLSRLNMVIAMLFLIFVLFLSDTIAVFQIFIESTGMYFQRFFELSTWSSSFEFSEWQNNWTIFYWAWWIAWSPFVGMFIARVSKGRTIREFVLGVLFVPTLMTFFWIAAFGGSALLLELQNSGVISTAVLEDSATSLFVFLKQFPLSSFTSIIGILMVSIFFVTSSDSGSLVIDSITSGGKLNAPVGQRILWALTEGAVAIALLIGGGLKAMQAASVSTGLLFLLVLFVICYSLFKSFRREQLKDIRIEKHKALKKRL
ncbi:BCCT family transporter [Flavobacteriaceae bacterium]|jgi:choline/glycine/proline betaine transport protein|nr:BCCT family transporter [Flavobacteriaceae bacterium]MDA7710802.1 BCCT family transporter [Flavobacteriaceae bacterium]MDA8900313.1 BCCT family transporter [Flavobacteriaceae bacterium]